ncbi:MAG TPA: TIGR02996 domain-containing protein, partial [Gemmata sp.]
MSEEAGFVAALVAAPTDLTTALVFADWLEERGDPRGPMLRSDEVRAWMHPGYENPVPGLAQ